MTTTRADAVASVLTFPQPGDRVVRTDISQRYSYEVLQVTTEAVRHCAIDRLWGSAAIDEVIEKVCAR